MAWIGSRESRGYDHRWRKIRARIWARDKYLCQPCLRIGRVTPGTQCDHVTPKAQGGTDDMSNLQTICKRCHDEKTMREKGVKPRQRIGLDGFPVEAT